MDRWAAQQWSGGATWLWSIASKWAEDKHSFAWFFVYAALPSSEIGRLLPQVCLFFFRVHTSFHVDVKNSTCKRTARLYISNGGDRAFCHYNWVVRELAKRNWEKGNLETPGPITTIVECS